MRRLRRASLALAALAAASSPAAARGETFLVIASAPSSSEAIVMSSIRRSGGTVRYEVVKVEGRTAMLAGHPFDYAIVDLFMDCANKTARYTHADLHTLDGRLQWSDDIAEESRSFAASEGMLKEWSVVCQGASLPSRFQVEGLDAAEFARLARITTWT